MTPIFGKVTQHSADIDQRKCLKHCHASNGYDCTTIGTTTTCPSVLWLAMEANQCEECMECCLALILLFSCICSQQQMPFYQQPNMVAAWPPYYDPNYTPYMNGFPSQQGFNGTPSFLDVSSCFPPSSLALFCFLFPFLSFAPLSPLLFLFPHTVLSPTLFVATSFSPLSSPPSHTHTHNAVVATMHIPNSCLILNTLCL